MPPHPLLLSFDGTSSATPLHFGGYAPNTILYPGDMLRYELIGRHEPLNMEGKDCAAPALVKIFDISNPFRFYSIQAFSLNIGKYWTLSNYISMKMDQSYKSGFVKPGAGWKPSDIDATQPWIIKETHFQILDVLTNLPCCEGDKTPLLDCSVPSHPRWAQTGWCSGNCGYDGDVLLNTSKIIPRYDLLTSINYGVASFDVYNGARVLYATDPKI